MLSGVWRRRMTDTDSVRAVLVIRDAINDPGRGWMVRGVCEGGRPRGHAIAWSARGPWRGCGAACDMREAV